MKLRRLFFSVLFVICSSINFSVPASAVDIQSSGNEIVTPAYEIAGEVFSQLVVSGNTAYCTSQSSSGSAVSISVEQTLEKHSGWFWIWNNVDGASWTSYVNRASISLYNSKGGLTSGTYRLKSVFTLTDSSGQTETITVYSEEKTVA